MSGDDVKARILARRAKFLAAALSGAGLAATATLAAGVEGCGSDQVTEPADAAADVEVSPQPCLEPPEPPRDAEPQPCLSPLPPDAGDDDAGDAGSDDAAGDAEPMPCLAPIP